MARRIIVVGFILLLSAVSTSASLAAVPRLGAFVGPTSDGGRIRIEVAGKTLIGVIKVTDGCGAVYRLRNVKVNSDGTFRKSKTNDQGIPLVTVSGEFTRRTVAKGMVSQVACEGGSTYSARRS